MNLPAAYAHDCLGRQVVEDLDSTRKNLVERWKDLFTIGLQGPDILFHYHALSKNPVNTLGDSLHNQTGYALFASARQAVQASPRREAALAYAYGLLCHFALDADCHGYVDEKIAASGISHTEIESELEREMMLRDNLNPNTHCPAAVLRPSKENSAVIALFYPQLQDAHILSSIKGMVLHNQLLLANSELKRKLIHGVLKLTGNYESMHGLVISRHGNPACHDSNEKLLALAGQARVHAGRLIEEFDAYLTGTVPSDPLLLYDFNGNLHEALAPS